MTLVPLPKGDWGIRDPVPSLCKGTAYIYAEPQGVGDGMPSP